MVIKGWHMVQSSVIAVVEQQGNFIILCNKSRHNATKQPSHSIEYSDYFLGTGWGLSRDGPGRITWQTNNVDPEFYVSLYDSTIYRSGSGNLMRSRGFVWLLHNLIIYYYLPQKRSFA